MACQMICPPQIKYSLYWPPTGISSLSNGRANNTYQYADKTFARSSYYRLKLNGEFGETEYSATVFVAAKGDKLRLLQIVPNPATSSAQISIDGMTDLDEQITTEMIGVDGRRLRNLNGALSSVNESLKIVVQNLPSGIYHLRISTAGTTQTLKLIRQ